MLLNTIINDHKLDLTDRKYVDLDDLSIRVYSIYQDMHVSVMFVVNRISTSNYYNVSIDDGLLVELNLEDGRIFTKDFVMIDSENNIFKETQKDFTEYKSWKQFLDNERLRSIFMIHKKTTDYRKTVYSMMSKDFISIVFSNYFRNLFEGISIYDIVSHLDDLDYDETLPSYLERKGLSTSVFNLYISTLKPNMYNYMRIVLERMFSNLLFNEKELSIAKSRIYNYFKQKNEDFSSFKKLKVVSLLIPANCKVTSLLNRFEDIGQLYKFDEYIYNMDNTMQCKVFKFMKDFISDYSDNSCINFLADLIEYISENFKFKDTEKLNDFIDYYYNLKESYDSELYEYGKQDGITAGVIRAGVSLEWLHYYDKAKSLNERFGSNIIYHPKDLISAHHQILDSFYYLPDRNIKLKLNKLDCYSKIEKIFGESHTITVSDKASLLLPKSRKDFIKEGLDLENSAYNYYDLVRNNKCMVLFLRRSDDVNKSICTLEFDIHMTKLLHTSCKNDKALNLNPFAMDDERNAVIDFCKDNNIDCSILNLD